MKNKNYMVFTFIIAFITLLISNVSTTFAKDIEYPDTNEAVVYTSAGLKAALTSTDITKIYLGADIKVTQYDIVVNTKTKKEIAIDGINPYSSDKTIHTLEEYDKGVTGAGYTIRITAKGVLEKVIVRNMNIIAHNWYGTICVWDGIKNLTQEFQNVNYKGPQMVYNRGGYLVIDNSNITLKDDALAANTGEVGEISGVTLKNEVNIIKEPIVDFDEIFWIGAEAAGNGYITVEPGANIKVVNNSYKDGYPSGFIYSDSKYKFEIGEGATFDYKGYRIFWECQPVTNMIVGKDATFKVDVSGCPSTGSLNGWVDLPLLKVYGGDFNINENADVSLILRNNKKAKETLGLYSAKLNLQSPKNLLIYNDGADAIVHYTKNPLALNVSSIAFWSNVSTDPYNLGTPKYLWKNNSGVFTINATANASNGTYATFNVTGYDNSGDKLDATTFNTKGIKAISLNGSKPVNNYSVKFISDDINSPYYVDTVVEGNLVTKPNDPNKADYIFEGWFKDNNLSSSWDFVTDKVTSDITLYAKWNEIAKFDVTFDLMGGAGNVPKQSIAIDQLVTKPADPVKFGSVLDGWYTEPMSGVKWDFTNDKVLDNMTLYARWIKKDPTYKVNFITDDVNNSYDTITVDKDSFVIEPTEPTKSEFVFVGWSREPYVTLMWDFSKDRVSADTNLYAIFTKKQVEFTVKFVAKGGSNIPSDQRVMSGEFATNPKPPTKAGDCFSGWFADPNFESRWIFSRDIVYNDVTLYGKWCYNN